MARERDILHPRYTGTLTIDPNDCYTEPKRNLKARARYHPETKEPLRPDYDGSIKLIRVWYAEAHEIMLYELDGYSVYPTRTFCGTKGCMNPKHWLVVPKNDKFDTPYPDERLPMPPEWLRGAD